MRGPWDAKNRSAQIKAFAAMWEVRRNGMAERARHAIATKRMRDDRAER